MRTRTTIGARVLLDDVVPTYDVASRHTIRVAADPAVVYDTVRHANLSRPWLVRLMMGVRMAPAMLARAFRGRRPTADPMDGRCSDRPAGFTLIAESPGEEFVLGLMGRFWTPSGGLVAASADQLQLPPPAGLAQGFWNFRVERRGSGTELSTETRVRCGDAATRRQFERYWRIIRVGSGLIRGSILRHIRRTAERRAA
jgi:hypothetical protein